MQSCSWYSGVCVVWNGALDVQAFYTLRHAARSGQRASPALSGGIAREIGSRGIAENRRCSMSVGPSESAERVRYNSLSGGAGAKDYLLQVARLP